MSEKSVVGTSEAEIAVHWQEEQYYYPSCKFIGQANLTDPAIFERFKLENFPQYYTEFAELLSWYKYWDEVLDTSDAPCWKWCRGGRLNASYNCIDRHLAALKHAGWLNKPAGLLIGDFHMMNVDTQAAVIELLKYHLPAARKVPVVTTRSVGHVWPMAPVRLNHPVPMSVKAGQVTIHAAGLQPHSFND